jgi:L-ascorbate peroxidase
VTRPDPDVGHWRTKRPAATDVPAGSEAELRDYLVALMPLEHAPAHLRLAFHDAGTHDRRTASGGAHGTVRLPAELQRAANTGWGHTCVELLAEAKAAFPQVAWADLIAVGGAAAVQRCGGPVIEVGLGRRDDVDPPAGARLPGGYEGADLLKSMFLRMGLGPRELVVLAGAHTLGHTQRRPFTADLYRFSNSYFVDLLAHPECSSLPTDRALVGDPELRRYVESYAADEALFWSDFSATFRRLTWLGNTPG